MPNLPFEDPRCQNLFKHVEDVSFPLIFDITDRIGEPMDSMMIQDYHSWKKRCKISPS